MSSLTMRDKRVLEDFLGMGSGYVLNFSDRTFSDFVNESVDVEIHADAPLAEQIRRMKDSVETDPSLAIGTAKELIETCCKTILAERGQAISGTLAKALFSRAEWTIGQPERRAGFPTRPVEGKGGQECPPSVGRAPLSLQKLKF